VDGKPRRLVENDRLGVDENHSFSDIVHGL
jgi:hypothetical protein